MITRRWLNKHNSSDQSVTFGPATKHGVHKSSRQQASQGLLLMMNMTLITMMMKIMMMSSDGDVFDDDIVNDNDALQGLFTSEVCPEVQDE